MSAAITKVLNFMAMRIRSDCTVRSITERSFNETLELGFDGLPIPIISDGPFSWVIQDSSCFLYTEFCNDDSISVALPSCFWTFLLNE